MCSFCKEHITSLNIFKVYIILHGLCCLLQILALLQKVGPTEVEEMVEIKEEPSDTPILEGVLGEGKFSLIQLCNLCDASTQFL
jgi:hypothetical protein